MTASVAPTGILIVDRILTGTAPDAVRAAAARGALPVPREILVRVLVLLASDAEPAIAASALESLRSVPEAELVVMLRDPGTDPEVLGFFATSPLIGREAFASVLANPALREQTVVMIASSRVAHALDMLLLNQELLSRTPSAVEALTANPHLDPDKRRRLLDFLEHAPNLPGGKAAREEEADFDLLGPVSEEELRSMLAQLGDLPFIDLEVGEIFGEGGFEAVEGFEGTGESSFETVFKQILRMNPPQRVRAALKGGREARQILIRDTNRVVSCAVLRNARLTEDEVISFAAQKSLAEEILRQIGSSRAWMGSYSVILNVVRNPKTPQAISMNNVARLSSRDLANIHRDRNIPEVVRRMAKKHLEMREPRPKSPKRH